MRRLGGLTRNVLPPRYGSPEQTPLRADVKPGKNELDFALTTHP
jgi:hypothetical protein